VDFFPANERGFADLIQANIATIVALHTTADSSIVASRLVGMTKLWKD
jgi:hypothetical protein